MRGRQRDLLKVGIAIAGMLFLLALIGRVPAAGAQVMTSESAAPGTVAVQATPTGDATVTALNKEQLTLQVKQLQKQLQGQNNWLANNSTALIAAVATVVVALFGILQLAITVRQAKNKDLRDRQDERQKEATAQDKDLRAQAEERFKTAVAALGDENEGTQVGGAILLQSFLNPDDEEIYGRYYTQIFDLAVAYLRFSHTPQSSKDPETLLPLTPLRETLVVVFKETFPLARKRLGQVKSALETRSLDASRIRLDNAYLRNIDLAHVQMRDANLIKAELRLANLSNAYLSYADLSYANLRHANLSGARLHHADLSYTHLREADLRHAYLKDANFDGARLKGADLSEADFDEEPQIEGAANLSMTDLRRAKGITRKQLEACKAKGAIIDEEPATSSSQSASAPPAPNDDTQVLSPRPIQGKHRPSDQKNGT